jgi:hypothetical protein
MVDAPSAPPQLHTPQEGTADVWPDHGWVTALVSIDSMADSMTFVTFVTFATVFMTGPFCYGTARFEAWPRYVRPHSEAI